MYRVFLFFVLLPFISCSAQSNVKTQAVYSDQQGSSGPKLVVGIVVDQMRYDYLTKFYSRFGEGGFKRLVENGFNCENAQYNYIPTYTAVGHASIYTGTTPQSHGIIGNNWYDKYEKKSIYCVDDGNYKSVGASDGGRKSPARMVTTTVTDELKMFQNQRGKVIGISIKDRSAILPAGHSADAAYWFQGADEGKFITSSYYRDELPAWVNDFNNSGKAQAYLDTPWNTLYDISTYTATIADDNPYEGVFKGKDNPTFPYDLKKLKKDNGNFNLLKTVPAGNTIVKDFAEAAILGEKLGQSNTLVDFLAVSFSSTDYVGHKFGVDSKEIEDTYLRLDRDLAEFLTFLDKNVGENAYTVFLTADHAAVQVPAYLKELKVPAGYLDKKGFTAALNTFLKDRFGMEDLIENFSNNQLFLDKAKIAKAKLNIHEVTQAIVDEVINYEGVYKAVSAKTLQETHFTSGILALLQEGYNQKRSGDVLLIHEPSVISYSKTGSTHGSGYSYDTHVPIIFYGNGIKKGRTSRYIPIVDIAPTISNLLGISFGNGTTGRVIEEVIQRD
ncbi:alkaline phosphatase family protein [Flavobacteriaceae bacterium F08102]|nr:alkaline phosphatase family protein [Flavobacteriaceae bacterium F08102]